MLEKYTGISAQDVINKCFNGIHFAEEIKTGWNWVLKEVIKEEKLVVHEMTFPIGDDKKAMLVNAMTI